VDSDRSGEPGLRRYFTRRALAAAVVSGVLAAITMAVLRSTATRVFSELTHGRSLPLVVVSVLAGLAVLVMLLLDVVRLVRPLAALAVAAVVWGWAVAQYPYLLPPRLTIAAATAPTATQAAVLVVVGAIVVLVAPSFALLFWLARAGRLGETEAQGALAEAPAAPGARAGASAAPGASAATAGADRSREQARASGIATAAVIVMVAAEGIRRMRSARRGGSR
jgi:cytochrome d ubiquinol oxidase subunit II